MTASRSRPLSPHLSIYRWSPHMLASTLHRLTGIGLATVGTGLFTWGLVALASGKEAYDLFLGWMHWWPMWIFPIGLSLAFFYHLSNGIRHLFMDMGAGFALPTNRTTSLAAMASAVILTALLWGAIFLGRA